MDFFEKKNWVHTLPHSLQCIEGYHEGRSLALRFTSIWVWFYSKKFHLSNYVNSLFSAQSLWNIKNGMSQNSPQRILAWKRGINVLDSINIPIRHLMKGKAVQERSAYVKHVFLKENLVHSKVCNIEKVQSSMQRNNAKFAILKSQQMQTFTFARLLILLSLLLINH